MKTSYWIIENDSDVELEIEFEYIPGQKRTYSDSYYPEEVIVYLVKRGGIEIEISDNKLGEIEEYILSNIDYIS